MDALVLAAMDKWPNVPAVYGWLRLDARGQWWLRDSLLKQPAMVDFFRRNYARDGEGRYYVQNGPQKVYVAHEAAPYVACRHGDAWALMPDMAADRARLAWLDEEGRLFVELGGELAIVDDRDLLALCELICRPDGRQPADADWQAWEQGTQPLQLMLPEGSVPLRRSAFAELEAAYHLVRQPQG
jgi:hypothetical protein